MSRRRRTPSPTFAARHAQSERFFADLDLYAMPQDGMPSELAYRTIADELSLDMRPTLNLATFVNTWMDERAERLAHQTLNVNLIDRAEYPSSTELHKREVWMVAGLLHAEVPDEIRDDHFIGTGTVGSSEAVMLAVIAHRQRWRDCPATAAGARPNIVIGGAFQACWEKVFKFFEIEARILPVRDGERATVTGADIQAACERGLVDRDTIAVALVAGTTFTAEVDEIEAVNAVLATHNDALPPGAWRVPIHVDAASGGFVLPFSSPGLRWDFRLSEVQSINLSNHKYGLVNPGLGTVVFRDTRVVPEELFTEVNYLGGTLKDYALNFSRGSWQVVCQYYNFLHLGRAGYAAIMRRLITTASRIATALQETYPALLCVRSAWAEPGRLLLPVVVIEVAGAAPFSATALSDRLRREGWFVPAYPYPHPEDPAAEGPDVLLRMVIRESFSDHLAERLLGHFDAAIADLSSSGPGTGHGGVKGRPIC